MNPAPVFQSPAPNTTVRFYMAVPNAFEISGENANPYDNIVLTSQFPLTVGQTLSPPIASEKRVKATDTATRVSATATLYWTPGITLGAYDETICFVLSQAGGPGIVPASSTRCVLMLVERCKYVTQAGDDMKKVGQIFQSDWLSLWGLNVHLDTFDPVFCSVFCSLRAACLSDMPHGLRAASIAQRVRRHAHRARALPCAQDDDAHACRGRCVCGFRSSVCDLWPVLVVYGIATSRARG